MTTIWLLSPAKLNSWLAVRAKQVTRPALVLDIDETAISNWQIVKLDDFGRPIAGRCAPGLDAP
jgi:acid phosphatase